MKRVLYRLGLSGADGLALVLIASGAALLCLAGSRWYEMHSKHHRSAFVTARATVGHIERTVTAIGTLQPREFVDVGTQVTGQLKTLHIAVGQAVGKGDLVAELDPALLASRVNMTEATLAVARAQLAEKQAQKHLAEQEYRRNLRLLRIQATSEEVFQQSRAALEQAAAMVDELNAQIKSIAAQLEGDTANLHYTRIFAPMSGTVVSVTAREGQTLVATQLAPIIMRIADLTTMTVWVQVSEADVLKIEPGMSVYFSPIAWPNRRWQGTVREILPTPETVNNVVLYDVLFDVPNPDGVLKPQMTAQTQFVVASADDAVIVPVSALRTQRQLFRKAHRKSLIKTASADTLDSNEDPPPASERGPFVQVRKPDGEIEERAVETGIVSKFDAQILSGVAADEEVVVGPESPPDGVPASPPRAPKGARL